MEDNKEELQYKEKVVADDTQLKELTSAMPEVVPDAIAAAEASEKEQKEQEVKDFFDNKGRKFDANIHQVDPSTNQPAFTPTGRFKRKIKLPEQTTSMDTRVIDPLRVEAEKYADMFIVGGMGFVGDEFKPGEGERESLVVAWYAVFQKYGIMPIHPAIGIFVAHGLYIFRRADKPRTQSILARCFNSIKFFFINIWGRMTGKDYKVVPKEEKKNGS